MIVRTFFEVVGVVCTGLFITCAFIIWRCEKNDKEGKYDEN